MLNDDIRRIKHLFFTYRNGEIASTLSKAGMPYRMIFGLQVPQIAAIAREFPQSEELADALWQETDVRESRILAAYLFPPETTDLQKALLLSRQTATREEADMMAFRLFRRLPFAVQLAETIEKEPDHPFPYTAEALRRNL